MNCKFNTIHFRKRINKFIREISLIGITRLGDVKCIVLAINKLKLISHLPANNTPLIQSNSLSHSPITQPPTSNQTLTTTTTINKVQKCIDFTSNRSACHCYAETNINVLLKTLIHLLIIVDLQ